MEILALQEFVYRLLIKDKDLMNRVEGVFTHVPENSNFPYIHINNIRGKNVGSKTHRAANIILNIAIYDRQNSYKHLVNIFSRVTKLLEVSQFTEGFLHVMKLSINEVEISQKNDGITNQLNAKIIANIYNGEKNDYTTGLVDVVED